MKILVVTNLYPPDVLGGYELGCRQAVEALRDAGHDVTVMTGNPLAATPTEPGLLRCLKLTDIYDDYYFRILPQEVKSLRALDAYGFHSFNVHVFTQHLDANRPDVVYFWNLTGVGGLGLITATQQMGLPWVMHVMDMVPQTLLGLGSLRPADPAVGRTFAAGCRGRFLFCSETVLRECEDCQIPVRRFARVLPNWVTTEGTQNRTNYLPGGKLRIMSAGRYSTYKGTDILIEAAGKLRDRGHRNFVLDLYGFGDTGVFQTQILERNLSEHVRLLGSRTQDELHTLYPQYDVFAFPTWAREPFGFAPLEAAAHGCVPIVSRECGFSEFVQDGIHCLKRDRNAGAFADAFEEVLTGQQDLPGLGRMTASAVLREFHLRTLLPRIVAELEDAIRTRPRGSIRSAAQAYQTAVLSEKVLLSLVQTQKVDGPDFKYPVPPAEYNFFDYLPKSGKANVVLGPVRRVLRKLFIPMFQRLRDLLLHLDSITSIHQGKIERLEAAVAHQKRQIDALTIDQLAAQRFITSRLSQSDPKELSRAA